MMQFTFDGKKSFDDFGVAVSKRPMIPSPKRRVTFMDIPGRHSSVRHDEETYEDITVLVECNLSKRTGPLHEQVDAIKAWLFGAGEQPLIFSYEPDKAYQAQVVNAIDFTTHLRQAGSFPVLFHCRPFKVEATPTTLTYPSSGQTIQNPGSVASAPIITIVGGGSVDLTVNGQSTSLIDVQDKIILNSDLQECYNEAIQNENEKMTGPFPILMPGANTISWSGSVSQIDITPNWRWL
ncbi:distal tail protein Dit [Salisediminibacterium selenitireducens]|uniref:Phage tail component n=1 Tax=Bacillus selenitireducens (strain ATCC 700615 / DSM 15326 / MLS10) TaxID=439292 RepID=D6XZX5_BACIE|nr:distal tail protein Dit [Salisediminibacterium selenitireducens]ADI00477.1 phage tail component [[Bacillus] selenitireducens MLS10]